MNIDQTVQYIVKASGAGYNRANVLADLRRGFLKITREGEVTTESAAKVAARRNATKAERAAFLSEDAPEAPKVSTVASGRATKAPARKKAPRATKVVTVVGTTKVVTTDHNRTCVLCGAGFVTEPKRGRPPVKCVPCRAAK